jgi:addiction module HigA family antidote
MIRSIRHKGLKRLYDDDDPRGVMIEHTQKLRDIIARLDAAGTVADMNLPGFRLHALKGELKGFWSVTVRANWRVIFRFVDRDAQDVDYVDYHRRRRLTMPMKNPPHPGGLVLRQCIEPLGLSITDAAAALGVTRTTLSELVNKKRGISPEMAVRLSKVFGGSAESWLTQQAHYNLAQVHADRIKLKRLQLV